MVSVINCAPQVRISLVKTFIAAGFVAAVAGCSSQAVVKNAPVEAEPKLPQVVKVADRNFDTETLYALLVAEFAGDRERFDVMLNNYVQQARATQDVEVAARAARLARYLNAPEAALEMSELWAQLEPNSLEAHFNATMEMVEANQLLPAFDHAQYLALQNEASGLDAIAARAVQINDPGMTQALEQHYLELSKSEPNHVPLLIGLSLLQQQTGKLDQALANTLQAQKVDPDSFQATAQEIRVLQQMGREQEALAKLGAMVERYPGNQRLRLQYARSLIKVDVEAAEEQFLALLAANPSDPDINLTVALIQYELNKYSEAKSHFLLLAQGGKHKSTAHAYLGRILLSEGNPTAAMRHLQQVEPGSEYLPSLAKITDIYIAEGDSDAAWNYLRQASKQADLDLEASEGITLLQSSVLNRAGKVNSAIEHLSDALSAKPESPNLLYARAMLYGQEDQLTAAEADLKQVIQMAPDNAAALNALGYTLADRTNRIEEAYDYIKRAYEISPNDPAVIDSMGWVQYRRGNYEQALVLLKQAFKAMPDDEIAAHLGEVLWVTGDQQLARDVWQQGLRINPKSLVIQTTKERLETGLSRQP